MRAISSLAECLYVHDIVGEFRQYLDQSIRRSTSYKEHLTRLKILFLSCRIFKGKNDGFEIHKILPW
uniref:AlNc14C149G7483 protein n=1 Tax=Albugo laibachii Nc14 TaxID=890382 RepID=F0WLW9_9STRA|nr:AlNc14C149G7483 [Albugo laibachii Nc14]|eukprot:CCA22296.1 AlNc14C149G7483 [Albugo laibachii Nc14]